MRQLGYLALMYLVFFVPFFFAAISIGLAFTCHGRLAGRIYFFDREGTTKVIAATPEFEVLAENALEDGFFASPAVAEDAFILRTTTHLYRIQD